MFNNYQQALEYIEQKIIEYGSKNKFYESEEYRQLYPVLQKLYKESMTEYKAELEKAMYEANINFGDRVIYIVLSPFGITEEYTGIVVKYKNTAYVKLDTMTADGRKMAKWHKGWKKIKR